MHIIVHNNMLSSSLGGLEIGRVGRSDFRRGADADLKPATPEAAVHMVINYLAEQQRLLRIERNEWSAVIAAGGTPAYCHTCGRVEDAGRMVNLTGIMPGVALVCEECFVTDDDLFGTPTDDYERNQHAGAYVAAYRHLRKRAAKMDQEGVRNRYLSNARGMVDYAAWVLDTEWDMTKVDRRSKILDSFNLMWVENDEGNWVWCDKGLLK